MLSFFPRDVLDEIWDLIESVSEGFLPNLTFNNNEMSLSVLGTVSRTLKIARHIYKCMSIKSHSVHLT